jgi:hypothetical protein
MADKRMRGWNPTYFGEPKKGSLNAVITDITNKQNAIVGDKPVVQDSVAVQIKDLKTKKEEGTLPPALQKAVDAKKKGKGDDEDKEKDEEGNAFGKAVVAAKEKGEKEFVFAGKKYNVEDESKHNKKDAKSPIKVHGEDLDKINKKIEQAQQGKIKSLVDTIKAMYKETNKNDKSDDGEGLDAVQPKAVKKKFKDRKDKDIDNDGDVDSSDKFLHKRRKAISKAIDK